MTGQLRLGMAANASGGASLDDLADGLELLLRRFGEQLEPLRALGAQAATDLCADLCDRVVVEERLALAARRHLGVALLDLGGLAALRLGELGGGLLVEPLPDGGTRVRARLPLPKEE